MTHFAFKKFWALMLTVVYSFVFVCCSPWEGTTLRKEPESSKSNTSTSSVSSTNSTTGYGDSGNWAEPPGPSSTTVIIMVGALIALTVAIVIVLSNKSADKESAAKLKGLDSVLTTPSSLSLAGTHGRSADSLSSFSVTVEAKNVKPILGGKVLVTFEQGGWRSILSFSNILGVADDPGGPYDVTSTAVKTGDIIYLKVNDTTVYRVRVKEEAKGNATFAFEKL